MDVPINLMPSNVRRGTTFTVAVTGLTQQFDGPLVEQICNKRSTSNNRLVERLGGSVMFLEFRKAFEDATGLPLTLRSVAGWQLAHSGSRRQNGFCALMSKSSRSCSACLQIQQRVVEGVNGVPCTMSCAFGLNETAVGVKVGNDIVAYLQTGQVFFKPPTRQQTQAALKQVTDWGITLDEFAVTRSYQETPVVALGKYKATIRLLEFFADQLGALTNQILLLQQPVESVQITRARKFIEEQYQDNLTLATMARQACMSRFYFCKVFKKETGVNFIQYLWRVRVEKAKTLLMNLNFRTSEVAFESGFQSLTHFNRVFRRVERQSPKAYRQRLRIA